MKAVLHPEALAEYKEAAAFYDRRRTELGTGFVREIENIFARVKQTPSRWGFIEEGVRRCPAQRFPYKVLYTVEGQSIFIVAVAHDRREPGYWRGRLPAK